MGVNLSRRRFRGAGYRASWTQKHRTANETTKRGRGGFDCRGAAIACRKRIPKKLASLGFGKRATASQKTQVIQKLRQEFSPAILPDVAQLPRATFYYHLKQLKKADKYHSVKEEIFSLFGEKLYLSPILDLHSSDLVSYTISERPVLSMVTTMLDKAIEILPNNSDLILHSDQG